MTARISEVLFVLALAATFLNISLVLALVSSARGTGRTTTVNVWYILGATALWVAWVVTR